MKIDSYEMTLVSIITGKSFHMGVVRFSIELSVNQPHHVQNFLEKNDV